MRRPLLLSTAALVGLVACTTPSSTPASSTPASGTPESGTPESSTIDSVPTQHRPVGVDCPAADVIPPDASAVPSAPGPIPFGPTCVTDSDCAGGGVCSCKGETTGFGHSSPGNVCVPANCRVDADCGPAGYCSPTVSAGNGPFYGVQGYYCHTPQDSCANDSDCKTGGYCAYQPTVGTWACGYSQTAG